MDRKTLLALFLILIVFWISSELIWKRNVTQQTQPDQSETEQVTTQPNDMESTQSEPIEDIEIPLAANDSEIEINDEIILQNDLLKITFSNLGAVATSVELANYTLGDKTSPVDLIQQNENILNLKLQMANGNIIDLKSFPYQYQQTGNKVIFTASTQYGTVQKIFTLKDKYELEMQIASDADNEINSYTLAFDSGIADTEEYLKMKNRDYKIVGQIDNDISKFNLSKLKEERVINGHVDWAAMKSKYFALAVIPNDLIDINKLNAFQNNESPAMKMDVNTDQATISHDYRLYFGPLLYDEMKSYGNGIENIVEMGPKFLQWISKIFMIFLSFIHGLIPSWGICIIIFAIVLKVLLYPLTHKSYESTTKMQKINPMMKEIQQKYKKDPQTMNAELQKLYKEHGVNPLGGCLPMLLQMPVIFALYPILRYSIDLRQASFMWLPDLSEPDPVWALPILMAVFMFVQQKLMAPSKQSLENMDEKQRAAQQSQKMMMYFMPIMMFFIFKGLSSGLVLYWTVFSIIGSVQQYYIKKKFS